jgi:hypothetical protein
MKTPTVDEISAQIMDRIKYGDNLDRLMSGMFTYVSVSHNERGKVVCEYCKRPNNLERETCKSCNAPLSK